MSDAMACAEDIRKLAGLVYNSLADDRNTQAPEIQDRREEAVSEPAQKH